MTCIASISSIQNCTTEQTVILIEKLVPENNVTSYVQRQESQEQEIVIQAAYNNFIDLLV